ncbi:MAG: threonine/serine exporter family protein [Labilithrix sp.]|nr:threonine/serine exporter family protein [Labilithrix sp.]MCW5810524.1 threonine/serine exporter family protein [Labilithrix sp.]
MSPHEPSHLSREALADYLLELGVFLASYGCPSYRLEDVIRQVAEAEGQRAEPFALPTGLFLRVTGPDGHGHQVHRMSRVRDWGVDLARLTLIDEIFSAVVDRKASIEEARARIREAISLPHPWSKPLVFCATVVLSGAVAVFFQGGLVDVFVAAVVGAVIAGSRVALSSGTKGTARRNARLLLSDFLGGLVAAACAGLAVMLWPEARPMVIVPAGAISLFPGMTFTTGVAEVAQKNIVAGGARLVEAAVTLLLIFFGVALMDGLADALRVEVPSWIATTAPVGLGIAWQAGALAVSSVAFAALFQVPWRWLWASVASSATGWIVAALLVRLHFPGHVAAFCAALAVCILANALARATNRPAQLFQLPGMMLLVPGSVGFLSLGDYFEGKVLDGNARVFSMMLAGAALVIGVLVANVVVPSRKLL